MKIVIFGLTISSSWGNGHATVWRSLIQPLLRRGHRVVFYERDVPYYSTTRDLFELPSGGGLRLYDSFIEVRAEAEHEVRSADLAICTSFCPDGREACDLVLDSRATIRAFYDLDTPVTLDALNSGEVPYLPVDGLGEFDVVLSYTGGRALDELKIRLGARTAVPLYGSVDPQKHRPESLRDEFRADLSYLGTYACDREAAMEQLFVEPARKLPDRWFLLGGAQYPSTFPWTKNIAFVRHVPPQMHPAFFSSCRATLNITRGTMARYGYCPSGRLFEAAACGAPILTDSWEGLDRFFDPVEEVVTLRSAQDVVDALSRTDAELRRMARAARERTLVEHTGERRAIELEWICESIRSRTVEEKCV